MNWPTTASPWKTLWQNRWFAYCVRAPLLAFAVSTTFLYFGQDWLLYAGSGGRSAMPAHDELAVAITDTGGRPAAWVAEPEAAAPEATVVFFHGNFSLAQHLYDARWPFLERNLRIIFVEYPGYGFRQAGAANAQSVLTDAAGQLKLIRAKYPDQPLWVFGESLGAAVAAQAIARSGVEVQRVMLAVPWNTLHAVAAEKYPWVPVSLLVKEDYDTCAALRPLADRVQLVVGANDKVIPPHHGKALAQCLGLPAQRVKELARTGHNDWYFGLTQLRGGWDWMLGKLPGYQRAKKTGPSAAEHMDRE